ncbi:hypothetical protein OAL45_00475 [bacterium]|nr:hypothetical protein [Verrucomicrobiota bacterium]MDC0317909.1 hypothetical protein [bacterium]
MHQNKKFDRSLHDQYDDLGKRAVIDYLSRFDLIAKEGEDRYDVDLEVYKRGKLIGYAEVEVRTCWESGTFPFDTLDIPERKWRFFKEKTENTAFYSVDKDLSAMFWCSASKIISKGFVIHKYNKYSTNKKEPFLRIKVEDLHLVKF